MTDKDAEIYIIGSGAIGKALAVFLKRQNKAVKLIRGSVDNAPTTTEQISVIGKDQVVQEQIVTSSFNELSTIKGIVLVTTKTFGNPRIAQKLKALNGDFSIVLLQNGLNIERPFKGFDKVYRCVLFSTSQVTANNEVTFKTVTASPVGNLQGNNQGLDDLISQINTPQFQFRSEPDIVKYIWNKTIANCVFNTICPLLETDNGIFHRNAEAEKLVTVIIDECASVAELQGVILNRDEVKANLLLISQKSDGQLISTYMDILNQRQTEIDSLNLEIAGIADQLGRPELIKNTSLLGQLIQIKSNEAMSSKKNTQQK